MDDYILKVLLDQEQTGRPSQERTVQEKLEEVTRSVVAFAEKGGEKAKKSEPEPEEKGQNRRQQVLNRVLERVRVAEETAGRETEAVGRKPEGERGDMASGEPAQAMANVPEQNLQTDRQDAGWQSQRWKDPEQLSMFFQRDARRYS